MNVLRCGGIVMLSFIGVYGAIIVLFVCNVMIKM